MTSGSIGASIPTSIIELLTNAGAAASVAAGQVHVISVSPIREALGPRWARRQEGIADFIERSFQRSALADDMIVRINEVDFIVVQPSWPPLGALNRASQLVRDTLSYFLGEARPENVRVAMVEALEGGVIRARPIAAPKLPPQSGASPGVRDLAGSTDGSPPWERFSVAGDMSEPVFVRGATGQTLEAFFYLEPIWNADAGVVASFLVQSVVFEVTPGGERLPPDEGLLTPQCHLALNSRRIAYLRQMLYEAPVPLVAHLPISGHCLRLSSTRAWLLSDLRRQLSDDLHRNVVIELCDIPDGFPGEALATMAAQAAPYGRAILARFSNDRPGIALRTRCGLNGIVRTIDGRTDERTLARELFAFADAARRLRIACAVYGLRTRSQVLIARAAGVTHVSGPAITESFGSGTRPRRFHLEHLYVRKPEQAVAAVA